jgi:hypothetical protein
VFCDTQYTKLKGFTVASAMQIRASAMFISPTQYVTIYAAGIASDIATNSNVFKR